MLKEGVGGECEVDSRTTPARTRTVFNSEENDDTWHLLFLTSRAPDLGPLETVYRAGQAGQVRSEADLFGSENFRFRFCFRMSPHSIMMFILWLLAVWFSWFANHRNIILYTARWWWPAAGGRSCTETSRQTCNRWLTMFKI